MFSASRICLLIFMICGIHQSDHYKQFSFEKPCKASKHQVCVEIRKCPLFEELLNKTTIPRPLSVIKLIRQYQCGFKNDVPKVCCTKQELIKTKKPKVVLQPTREYSQRSLIKPPNVTNHRNIQFIPQESCGPIAQGFRIIGGTKTAPFEFPWMALLSYDTGSGVEFRCGGTLINRRYVLTAAHCIDNNLTMNMIRLGEHNIDTKFDCDPMKGVCAPPVQEVRPEKVIVHPSYVAQTFENDIGLIKLALPANTTQGNIQPICLPIGDLANLNLEWTFGTICGWGLTDDGQKSNTLQKTTVPVIPTEKCRGMHPQYFSISYRQLCAGGYQTRDSCGGDSGGPLQYVGIIMGKSKYVQHGVVSYGPMHCGAEGQPGVYTNVAYYMSWILDNLEEG